MSEKPVRVFCVHSKTRPLQAKFYEALYDSLQGLGVALTHYREWSWETSGGRSAEDLESEQRRTAALHRQGYSNLRGMGWIQNAPTDLKITLQKQEYPAPDEFNEGDLVSLLSDSHCLILLEDEHQEQLSEGVHTEVGLIRSRNLDKRVLNIRLYKRREDAYFRSIYPFSGDLPLSGVVGIGMSPNSDIRPEDIELVTFIIALWCAEEGGGQAAEPKRRGPVVDPGFDRCPVGMEAGDLYRYKTAIHLATSEQDHIRRTALLYMSAARTQGLRHALCRWLANLFRHDGPWQQHVNDFLRFMEFLPDIDWRAVTGAIRQSLRPSDEFLISGAELISGVACFHHMPIFGLAEDKEKSLLGSELLERLRSIPRWAIVGFAAHAARSSWDMYAWHGMSRRQAEHLKETMLLAESAAAAGRLEVREVVSKSSLEMCRERLGALAATAAATAAYASAACFHEESGLRHRAAELDERARDAVAKVTLNVFSDYGVKRVLEQLDLVAATSKRCGWDNSTPIPTGTFASPGTTQSRSAQSSGEPPLHQLQVGKRWWQFWR